MSRERGKGEVMTLTDCRCPRSGCELCGLPDDTRERLRQLQAIVSAQADLLSWYETEHDRGEHSADDLPEDFRELEEALEAANAAKGK